ncbi:hypothetical protein DPMN_189056 [Dreissena polymorpha]|uniref:Uncharacterized protein n=1 Tax=Dreissena polymorpha TaxID=45954 RepID=A0A9D4IBY4_DREPO|nr:hypothetical protein DPMN_189056 [Dreissena polymorpha]
MEIEHKITRPKPLTKFHKDGTTNQILTDGRTDDGQRPVRKAHLSNQVIAASLPYVLIGSCKVTSYKKNKGNNSCLKQEHRLAGADRSSIFFLKVKGLSFSITKEGGCGGVEGTGDGLVVSSNDTDVTNIPKCRSDTDVTNTPKCRNTHASLISSCYLKRHISYEHFSKPKRKRMTDGWTDGMTDGRTDRQTDRRTEANASSRGKGRECLFGFIVSRRRTTNATRER